jgi:hypothetical protein
VWHVILLSSVWSLENLGHSEYARFEIELINDIDLPARSNYGPTYVIFATSPRTQYLVPKQKSTIWPHRQFVFYIALCSSHPSNTKPDAHSKASVYALIVKISIRFVQELYLQFHVQN